MVLGGSSSTVEIVDLQSLGFKCQGFPFYPEGNDDAKGETDNEGNPIVCEEFFYFWQPTNQCYTFVKNTWKSITPLVEARRDFQMISSSMYFCEYGYL